MNVCSASSVGDAYSWSATDDGDAQCHSRKGRQILLEQYLCEAVALEYRLMAQRTQGTLPWCDRRLTTRPVVAPLDETSEAQPRRTMRLCVPGIFARVKHAQPQRVIAKSNWEKALVSMPPRTPADSVPCPTPKQCHIPPVALSEASLDLDVSSLVSESESAISLM